MRCKITLKEGKEGHEKGGSKDELQNDWRKEWNGKERKDVREDYGKMRCEMTGERNGMERKGRT